MADKDVFYLNQSTAADWNQLQKDHKAALAEMEIIQERQNKEFVELHGLPANATKHFDDVVLRYGWKSVQRHLDKSMLTWCKIKDLTDVELERLRGNLAEMREGEIKEQCVAEIAAREEEKEARIGELKRLADKAKQSVKTAMEDFDDSLDISEPVIEPKSPQKMGARKH